MPHATLRELEEHASGSPAPELESHLAECSTCAEELERVRSNCELLDRLRQTRGGAPIPPPTLVADQPFEGYTVTRELHRGGQGIVYGATQLATSRQVAIKVLAEGIFASDSKLRRFEREIELVSALRHPNIVTVYDSGTTADNRDFLVMEYVRGEPLHRYVEGAQLSRTDLVRLCAKVAAAVGYAHRRGVIHRDLKPNNVLVDDEGEPRVLDFGLARGALRPAGDRTRSNEFLGTLAFASPEQLGGDPDAIDVRTDVYSLGVLFYGLLAGRSPYGEASSVADLVSAITSSDPVRPTGDADLDAVVRRAMEKAREDRYQSAGDLAEDLENVLAGRPVVARRDSAGYVLRKLLWRHRVVASLSALTVLALVAGAIASFTGWQRATAEAERARIESAKASELNAFLASLFEGLDPWRALGPDVSVRQMLDDASARIASEPPDEPAVELELRALIGRSYHALGFFDQASPHLEAAVDLAEEPGSSARLASLFLLSENLLALGDLDRAQNLLARVERELAASDAPAVDSMLGRVRGIEVRIANARGDEAGADRLFDDATRLLERSSSTSDLALLRIARGQYLGDLGRHDEASQEFDRAAVLLEEMGAKGTVLHSSVLRGRGRLFNYKRDFARAADAYEEALAIAEPLLGREHPRCLSLTTELALARASDGQQLSTEVRERLRAARASAPVGPSEDLALLWNELALISEMWDELAEAERCYERSLECYDALPGEFEYTTPVIRSNLSWMLHLQGDSEQAEAVGRRALEVFKRTPARWPVQIVRGTANQTWILYENGEPEEAERVATFGFEVALQHLPEDGPDFAEALSTMGLVHLRNERWEEAELALRAALEVLDPTVDPLSSVRLFARDRLARALAKQPEHGDEAEALLFELADEYLRSPHGLRFNALSVLNEAAYIQNRDGRPGEALATYTHAAELARGADSSLADPRIVSLSNAARLHGEAGDRDTEQALLRDAVSTARLHLPIGHPHRHAPLILLAMSLEATGRETEALAFREELHTLLLEAYGPKFSETKQAEAELFARYEALGEDERAEHLRTLSASR